MTRQMTYSEFMVVYHKLSLISDTWADLWMMISLTGRPASQIVLIKFSHFHDNRVLIIPSAGRYAECRIVKSDVQNLIRKRRDQNTSDSYLFQSHSNRVKKNIRPVTIIAFNRALKTASETEIGYSISSKTALQIV